MGDTKTHAAIGEKVIEKLKSGLPADNYEFFRMGNWLTDMSQLRDPPAHIGAKLTIWRSAQTGLAVLPGGLELYAGLNHYLDDLMGTPGKDGALAIFFRELTFYMGCEKYRKRGVEVNEFKEIFHSNWTQYYPHEHLDFPPYEVGKFPGDHTLSDQKTHVCGPTGHSGGKRKTLNYLDRQITYIGFLLTVVEDQWARLVPTDSEVNKKRHRVLARYGHASHAVEDFFFHSNFVEAAWEKSQGDHAQDGFSVRESRIFYRRQRSLIRGPDTEHADYIFTGYFGAEDIFHTLMDAAKGFEQDDPLLGDMLQKMLNADETKQADELRKHRSALAANAYSLAADLAVTQGKIHTESAESVKRMCKIDYELGLKYPRVANDKNKVPLGVFGFIQSLAIMARKKEEESDKARQDLDKKNKTKDDNWQDGATVEDIGSHSLMTKDSERKHPLRNEAVNLATCTALYIAKRMIERVGNSLPAGRFDKDGSVSSENGATNTVDATRIDWIHLLQHCLSHPDESEGSEPGSPWWRAALQDESAETFHNVLPIKEAVVQKCIRLEEKWRKELQHEYNKFAEISETDWRQNYRPGGGF